MPFDFYFLFLSDAINAFLFGHGPMTVTLANIFMLTGLRVTCPVSPYEFLNKGSNKLDKLRGIGGWSSYITSHKKATTIADEKEHIAFLNMWLEKFIFYGSSCGPTINHQYLAEHLVAGGHIPLGKYLLGSTYYLMHQVSVQLLKNELIDTISGPWWLIQLWLNLYLHKVVTPNLRDLNFSSLDFSKDFKGDESEKIRRCTSYGEAASAIEIDLDICHFSRKFYKGFSEDITFWLPYDNEDNELELPYKFWFETGCSDQQSS